MDGIVKPILVAACGNTDAADDAFGPMVAKRLRADPIESTEILDLAINPIALLEQLEGRRMLILVDAASGDNAPSGRLIDADWFAPDRPRLANENALSTHGLGLSQTIELARQLQLLPDSVRIMAATVGAAVVGQPVSAALPALVTQAVQRIRQMCGGLSHA